ncbi:hypothetical protein ACSQ67_012054 [Phaseolus vulgaris]
MDPNQFFSSHFFDVYYYIMEWNCLRALQLLGLFRILCADIYNAMIRPLLYYVHSHGTISSRVESQSRTLPSVIVIGAGISGIAAARSLHEASFKVTVLESQNRLGGRIHTDFSLGCPVDMGASWLHGVCNENPLAPIIRGLGLPLYRTSGDNSVLYDHDLESYMLFNIDGKQVPQQLVIEVGDTFKKILEKTGKVRDEHPEDISVSRAISVVLDRHPELRQKDLPMKCYSGSYAEWKLGLLLMQI